MYQLATDSRSIDKTRLFVETCTSMMPNSDNMNLVRSATKLMRTALNSADLKPMRDIAAKVSERCDDIDDVFAHFADPRVTEYLDIYEERAPRWFTPALIAAVRERMRQLMGRWKATPFGETMALTFPPLAPPP